jgi:hypothetical protein
LKRHTRNPLDFRLAVAHGVDRLPRALFAFDRAWFAEIQPAQQFAYDQDVGALYDFFAQRRTRSQHRIKDRRTQIGERPQFLAKPQQSGLRAKLARIAIEGGIANRSQQHGVRIQARLYGRIGQGIAELLQGNAADLFFVELEIVAESVGQLLKNANRLRRNFRADSVSGEGGDTELHKVLDSSPEIYTRKRYWR